MRCLGSFAPRCRLRVRQELVVTLSLASRLSRTLPGVLGEPVVPTEQTAPWGDRLLAERPPCARLPVTNFSSAYSGGKMTPRIGLPFCCRSRRLQIPRLLLVCVTCHATLLQPGLEGSASLVHLLSNNSHQEQGFCEAEARLASSLDFWTLSSESLIGTWWRGGAALRPLDV